MTQRLATNTERQQLSFAQFLAELLFDWRRLLACIADISSYQRTDVDRVAGVLRADFVHLPVFRFMDLDPVRTYTASRPFFRWAQQLCSNCSKQNNCSLLTASAKTLPVFEQYCSNADRFHRRVAEQTSA